MDDLWEMLRSVLAEDYLPFKYLADSYMAGLEKKKDNVDVKIDTNGESLSDVIKKYTIDLDNKQDGQADENKKFSGNLLTGELEKITDDGAFESLLCTGYFVSEGEKVESNEDFVLASTPEICFWVTLDSNFLTYNLCQMTWAKSAEAEKEEEERSIYDQFYEKIQEILSSDSSDTLDYRVVKVTGSAETEKLMSFFLEFQRTKSIQEVKISLDNILSMKLLQSSTDQKATDALVTLKLTNPVDVSALKAFKTSARMELDSDSAHCKAEIHYILSSKRNVIAISRRLCADRPMIAKPFSQIRDTTENYSSDEEDNNREDLGSDDDWDPYENIKYDDPIPVYGDLDEDETVAAEEHDAELSMLIQGLLSLGDPNMNPDPSAIAHSSEQFDDDNTCNHSHEHDGPHIDIIEDETIEECNFCESGHGHSHNHSHEDDDDLSIGSLDYDELSKILDLDNTYGLDMENFKWDRE